MFLPLKDHNPTVRTPVVTIAFIAANALVFFMELTHPGGMTEFIARWGATPFELTTGEDFIGTVPGSELVHPEGPAFLPLTALTSMFLHGGWMHLIFNMLYLWIFGNNVEDALGRVRFILFYVGTGLMGLAAHVLTDTASLIPTVGASGAISGILGAYLMLYPRARVTCLVFIFFFIQTYQLPALYMLGIWFAMQLLSGVSSLGIKGGGVAYWAHIGGFAAGWIVIRWIIPASSPWRVQRGVYASDTGLRRPPSSWS